MLTLLRCAREGGELALCAGSESYNGSIVRGSVRCKVCGADYTLVDGILRLLPGVLTSENQHEMTLRDSEYQENPAGVFEPARFGWRSKLYDRTDVAPHMAALGSLDGKAVLEFGCGDGRFTIPMAQMGAEVVAVDLSLAGLCRLGAYLQSGVAPTTYQVRSGKIGTDLTSRVGLVQADASQFCVAPQSFDRAISATPLDSRDERMRMYRTIADALKDSGRFVGGVEHDDLTRRILGEPVARRYTSGGVFIEHFDPERMRSEAAPYFDSIAIRPIRPRLPLVKEMPLPLGVAISKTVAALPILRQFGELLLMRAERPVRAPVEGVQRRGSRVAKNLYSWYRRRRYGVDRRSPQPPRPSSGRAQ